MNAEVSNKKLKDLSKVNNELKESHVMKSHIYRYLIKRYNKYPVLDLGSGAFFGDAD